MEKFLESAFYALLTVLGLLIKDWAQKRKAKQNEIAKKQKLSIEYTSIIHEKIKNAENDIMKVYRPLRMFMFLFYNGDVTDNNLSLKKITIRHEITLYPGISYITEHYQGRPVPEMFYDGIKKTFAAEYCEFGLKDIEQNPPLKDFYDTWDIKSMLWISINDKMGEPAAIMVMQWPGDIAVNKNDILKIKAKKIDIENIYNV